MVWILSVSLDSFQPFLLQPFPLLRFDSLIVLRKVFPDTTLTHANLVTEAFHLPVIKAIQNLESKLTHLEELAFHCVAPAAALANSGEPQ